MNNLMPASNQYLNGCKSSQQENLFEAESMILGAVILEPELIHELILEPCHFSQKRNQLLFQAMRDLQKENQPIDVFMIVEKLESNIEQVGGVHYITEIASCCPTAANYEYYQKIVLDHYKLRILKKSALQFLNEQTLERAEDFNHTFTSLQDLGKTDCKSKEDVLLEIYQELTEDQGEISGIDTGFSMLNCMLSGFQNGDLIIIAARPSVGKTALALNLAQNCCKKDGTVDFFSLEMPAIQLTKRMLGNLSCVDGSKWRSAYHYFDEEDQKRALNSMGVYYGWNLYIHDEPRQTVMDIRAAIHKTKRKHPDAPHLVVIDYLQLITQTKRFERYDLAIGDITQDLKRIARKYEVPIVLLSQLSRGVEQRNDKRPVMSDLRGSGNIEQDADVIMLLSRAEVDQVRSDKSERINLNIAKQRNGTTGVVKLLFEKQYSRFRDVQKENTH